MLTTLHVSAGTGIIAGAKGTLNLLADGNYTYTSFDALVLAVGAQTTDVFNYTVSDLPGLTDDATLTITITGVATGNGNNNHLLAAPAGNTLSGLDGSDQLDGNAGVDTLVGGKGDDTLNGGANNDILNGGTTTGVPASDDGNDTLNGGAGNDTLYGGTTGTLDGGDDNDHLFFGSVQHGGNGNDILEATKTTTTVTGDADNDTVNFLVVDGPVAGVSLDGGAGFDSLLLRLSTPTLPQGNHTIDFTSTTIANFESFTAATSPFPIQNFHFRFLMTSAQFNQFDNIIFPTNLDHTFKIADGGDILLPSSMGNNEKIQLNDDANLVLGSVLASGSVTISCGGGGDLVTGTDAGTPFLTVFLDSGDDFFSGLSNAEVVHGGTGGDEMNGGFGDDTLFGDAGNDTISGGGNSDFIIGGLGKDSLRGGQGGDSFYFNSIKDSGKTAATRDHILDFTHPSDHIDLSSIDANSKAHGVQHFKFIKAQHFHHKPGELHYLKSGGNVVVEGDVNGDGKSDFSFQLDHKTSVASTDLILHH
jgi:Ca2+-binding RTX toxin-like protein